MEDCGILALIFFLVLLASIVYAITRVAKHIASRPRTPLPKNLHVHLWTLAIWTILTFFQTLFLLVPSNSPHLIEHLVLFIAGGAMIFSQHRLIKRRRGVPLPNSGSYYFRGLFLQTLWGPLSLGIATFLLYQASHRIFWSAITHRDIPRISLLRTYGFDGGSETDLEEGLETVIRRQDSLGVVTYLEAGANAGYVNDWWETRCPLFVSVKHDSSFITGLLLRYKANPREDVLVYAVTAGHTKQVRTLLTYKPIQEDIRSSLRDSNTHSTLIHIAYKHRDTKMIALLKATSGTP